MEIKPGPAIGKTVATAEIEDGAVTLAKLASDAQGEWVHYETKDLETTPATSASFTSLPNHQVWKLVWFIYPNFTATSINVGLQFNGDTGNNYASQWVEGTTNNNSTSQPFANIGDLTEGGGADYQTVGECMIFNAQGDAHMDDTEIVTSSRGRGQNRCYHGGSWTGNATITQIDVVNTSGQSMKGKIALFYHQNLT